MNIELEKTHNVGKKVLFVDDQIPHFDKTAGARTSFLYLRLLTDLGMIVTFLATDFQRAKPYEKELKKMGVKIVTGRWFRRFWRLWLFLTIRRFDYVFCNRPAPTMMVIDLVKKLSSAKVLYQCHDLHYLRWQRSYAYDRSSESLNKAKVFEKIERYIFEQADVLLTFSEFEKNLLTSDYPEKQVEAIPLFFYKDTPDPNQGFLQRKGLLFVGGFSHTPNADAVKWFVGSIYPKILANVPDIIFYVAGSAPPPEILSLENEHIKILGLVSDQDLCKLYNSVQLVVVPLRFGAGIKGKVIEAIHYGTPLVSTSIGLEGIKNIEMLIEPVDTDRDFINKILSLYNNHDDLNHLSSNLHDHAKNNFSENYAKNKIVNILGIS